MQSLMQNEKVCYITGSVEGLHKHHIFGGPNRSKSEEYGLWVWLRADWHNMSRYGVHFDKRLDIRLKQDAQEAFEKVHGHEAFMREFGKNWL